MSLPKLGEKAKGILEAPEKDLKNLLENTPLGAPPKLSAALGKAGKGIEEEIELPELPFSKGEGLGEEGKFPPELPELPELFGGEGGPELPEFPFGSEGEAGLAPPKLGEEGTFPPELPKLEELVPFKVKEEKSAATPSPGAGPTTPTPSPSPEGKGGILRSRQRKVKEGILRER